MIAGARYAQAVAERPELLTARLVLRRPTEFDIPAIVKVCARREVAFMLGRVPHPYDETDARSYLETITSCELVWGIFYRGGGPLIGMIGLQPIATSPNLLELGYYLAPEHWGRGLITEAGASVAAYGRALVGAGNLCAGYYAGNPASGRVLAKLGFVEAGLSERTCLASGLTHASIEMRR